MGILNVTPDSFSDGGKFSGFDAAIEQAGTMIDEGAAVIDIGGESTRPGAGEVSVEEELERTIPVVRELAKQFPGACLSIDTSKAEVARAAIQAGAHVINDITGFRDDEMVKAASESSAGVVVMHMQGTPRTMQQAPEYDDVVVEVRTFFQQQLDKLVDAGVSGNAIVFDPGIGFGKTVEHNLSLLNLVEELVVGNCPILLGVSRKSFIGRIINRDSIANRSGPTVGITAFAAAKGVKLHRVHEVKANLDTLRVIEAIAGS